VPHSVNLKPCPFRRPWAFLLARHHQHLLGSAPTRRSRTTGREFVICAGGLGGGGFDGFGGGSKFVYDNGRAFLASD
jgi:hypothetical protein